MHYNSLHPHSWQNDPTENISKHRDAEKLETNEQSEKRIMVPLAKISQPGVSTVTDLCTVCALKMHKMPIALLQTSSCCLGLSVVISGSSRFENFRVTPSNSMHSCFVHLSYIWKLYIFRWFSCHTWYSKKTCHPVAILLWCTDCINPGQRPLWQLSHCFIVLLCCRCLQCRV